MYISDEFKRPAPRLGFREFVSCYSKSQAAVHQQEAAPSEASKRLASEKAVIKEISTLPGPHTTYRDAWYPGSTEWLSPTLPALSVLSAPHGDAACYMGLCNNKLDFCSIVTYTAQVDSNVTEGRCGWRR